MIREFNSYRYTVTVLSRLLQKLTRIKLKRRKRIKPTTSACSILFLVPRPSTQLLETFEISPLKGFVVIESVSCYVNFKIILP